MARDLGVQADYVDRAFRKSDDAIPERHKTDQLASKSDRLRADLESLEKLQASRPLTPPKRKP